MVAELIDVTFGDDVAARSAGVGGCGATQDLDVHRQLRGDPRQDVERYVLFPQFDVADVFAGVADLFAEFFQRQALEFSELPDVGADAAPDRPDVVSHAAGTIAATGTVFHPI